MMMLVKFKESFIFDPSIHSWSWAMVTPVMKEGVLMTKYRRISEEFANTLIKREGLVRVEHDRSMWLYDTPDLAFQKKYKKKILVTDLQ